MQIQCLSYLRPCQGVDATGFEPATSASRTQRSTKLSHASICRKNEHHFRDILYSTAYLHVLSITFYPAKYKLLLERGTSEQ